RPSARCATHASGGDCASSSRSRANRAGRRTSPPPRSTSPGTRPASSLASFCPWTAAGPPGRETSSSPPPKIQRVSELDFRRRLDLCFLALGELALECGAEVLAGDTSLVARAPRLEMDDAHVRVALAVTTVVRLRLGERAQPGLDLPHCA